MVIRWLVGAEQLPHRWLNGQRFRCPKRCSHLRSSMTGWPFGYPLVNEHSYLKMAIYSEFSHWKLWFSIAMLVYQEGTQSDWHHSRISELFFGLHFGFRTSNYQLQLGLIMSHPSTPRFPRQPRAAKVGRDPPDPGHWDRGRRHDQVDLPQHRALEMVRRLDPMIGHVGHVGPKSCTQQVMPKFMDFTSWTF